MFVPIKIFSFKTDLPLIMTFYRKEDRKMENLWLIFFWSGPIGLGIGLTLIGVFVLLLAKADEISNRTKAFKKEKGLEKKKD